MAVGAVLAVVSLLVALAAPLVLWVLIESETERARVMDRESAEREAREDYRRERGESVDTGRSKRNH